MHKMIHFVSRYVPGFYTHFKDGTLPINMNTQDPKILGTQYGMEMVFLRNCG